MLEWILKSKVLHRGMKVSMGSFLYDFVDNFINVQISN